MRACPAAGRAGTRIGSACPTCRLRRSRRQGPRISGSCLSMSSSLTMLVFRRRHRRRSSGEHAEPRNWAPVCRRRLRRSRRPRPRLHRHRHRRHRRRRRHHRRHLRRRLRRRPCPTAARRRHAGRRRPCRLPLRPRPCLSLLSLCPRTTRRLRRASTRPCRRPCRPRRRPCRLLLLRRPRPRRRLEDRACLFRRPRPRRDRRADGTRPLAPHAPTLRGPERKELLVDDFTAHIGNPCPNSKQRVPT